MIFGNRLPISVLQSGGRKVFTSFGSLRTNRFLTPCFPGRGLQIVPVSGRTVGQVIDALNEAFPGIKARLCEGDSLRPGLAAVVDTQVARLGLYQPVGEKSEVHFLPAIGGGAFSS